VELRTPKSSKLMIGRASAWCKNCEQPVPRHRLGGGYRTPAKASVPDSPWFSGAIRVDSLALNAAATSHSVWRCNHHNTSANSGKMPHEMHKARVSFRGSRTFPRLRVRCRISALHHAHRDTIVTVATTLIGVCGQRTRSRRESPEPRNETRALCYFVRILPSSRWYLLMNCNAIRVVGSRRLR